MEFTIYSKPTHIELFARTHTVAYEDLIILLGQLGTTVRRTGLTNALLVVAAPNRSLRFVDQAAIWSYAIERGLRGARLAYVVAGRTLDADTYFAESFSYHRGLSLRFFVQQSDALSWLLDSAAADEPVPGKIPLSDESVDPLVSRFLT